jgi:aminomethyltransferase
VSSDLYLQSGQAREALLLDERGAIELDLVVARQDSSFLIGARGPDPSGLVRLLERACEGRGASARSLAETHRVVGLHGPYAWELVAAWLGPEFVAMPHLACDRRGEVQVVRAGKSGEYGYEVLVPLAEEETLRRALLRLAPGFGALELDAEALALAALQNGFFHASSTLPRVRCPLELQLGWRLSHDKSFRGSEAILRRRAEALRRRLTWATSDHPLSVGDVPLVDGEPIGEIVHALHDPVTEQWVAIALLPISIAWAGHLLRLASSSGRVHDAPIVRTVSPPLLHNRSLFVSPQRHTYLGRSHDTFPEIWP